MADVVIYDKDNNEVFNSDDGPGMGEEFLTSHPNETFKVVISNKMSGMKYSGEMTAEPDDQST